MSITNEDYYDFLVSLGNFCNCNLKYSINASFYIVVNLSPPNNSTIPHYIINSVEISLLDNPTVVMTAKD
jgi:hypothetical protein